MKQDFDQHSFWVTIIVNTKRIEIQVIFFLFRVKLVILYQLFSHGGGGRWGLRNWQNCTMGWFKRNGQDRRLGKNEMWHEGVVVVSLTNNSHREREM